MSGIGKIAFEHLKYNHANNHDNIVTIFFSLLRKPKKFASKIVTSDKSDHIFEKMCYV